MSLPGLEGASDPVPKKIAVESVSGDIAIRMGSDDKPHWPAREYTHDLYIKTESGNVLTGIVHGSKTTIRRNSRWVGAGIITYYTTDVNGTSEIITSAITGTMHVIVSSTERDIDEEKYPFNVLNNTRSKHEVEDGELWLVYLPEWYGELKADISEGQLLLNGTGLDIIKPGERFVQAKRGRK